MPPPHPAGKHKASSMSSTDSAGTATFARFPQPRCHCSQAGCFKTLPLTSQSSHSVCIACRRIAGFQHSIDRYNEYCSWLTDQVHSSHSIQIKLGKAKAKGKGSSTADKKSFSPLSVDSASQVATNDQVNQQVALLISGGACKDILTCLIMDIVKFLLPDLHPTASLEVRYMCTATGLCGPLSAPTDKRYLKL